jgi:hypothetical protein
VRAARLGPAVDQRQLERLDLLLQSLVVKVVDVHIKRTEPAHALLCDGNGPDTLLAVDVGLHHGLGHQPLADVALSFSLALAPDATNRRFSVGCFRSLEGSQQSLC